jgi:predicted CoA-substrate-specific enzyme activase
VSWFVGIDIGSAYSKGVISKDSELIAWHVIISGANHRTSAEAIMTELLRKASLSTKAIRLNQEGMVTNFAVSEKCAAGGGRFIEVIANVLRIDLSDFGPLSAKSRNPVIFGTGCAVFGESEAITRVSEGIPKEDIAAGVNKALASNVSSLVRKLRLEEPCVICGGGALNTALVKVVENELNISLLVPPHPQIITALGAAITAATSTTPESSKEQN